MRVRFLEYDSDSVLKKNPTIFGSVFGFYRLMFQNSRYEFTLLLPLVVPIFYSAYDIRN